MARLRQPWFDGASHAIEVRQESPYSFQALLFRRVTTSTTTGQTQIATDMATTHIVRIARIADFVIVGVSAGVAFSATA
jgi:hypothetical protein